MMGVCQSNRSTQGVGGVACRFHRPVRCGGTGTRRGGAAVRAGCPHLPHAAAARRPRSHGASSSTWRRRVRARPWATVGRRARRHGRRRRRRQPARRPPGESGTRRPVGGRRQFRRDRRRTARRSRSGSPCDRRPGGWPDVYNSPRAATKTKPWPGRASSATASKIRVRRQGVRRDDHDQRPGCRPGANAASDIAPGSRPGASTTSKPSSVKPDS